MLPYSQFSSSTKLDAIMAYTLNTGRNEKINMKNSRVWIARNTLAANADLVKCSVYNRADLVLEHRDIWWDGHAHRHDDL